MWCLVSCHHSHYGTSRLHTCQVWHRRWFQRPKPLGQAVLPLRYLLETHQGSTSKVPARGPVMTATAAAAAGISSADGAGCVRAGDMDGLPPISTGRMEGWMRLGGKGARGGEVQVRLQFLPYLLS
ncbi:hypothetical protein Vretifemale_20732 [Volvox reticuliferus]|uniref:Uncharacterized protein n=1 Tax=Volvox reticuliferus TaxID=1737510 RepID=A0A8J4D0E4_9CHLO|nr:hypothetical protein Vretifemale_20732 [Volvox reticuliferus]